VIEKSEIQALLQMEGQDDAALTETGFIRTLERSCGFSLIPSTSTPTSLICAHVSGFERAHAKCLLSFTQRESLFHAGSRSAPLSGSRRCRPWIGRTLWGRTKPTLPPAKSQRRSLLGLMPTETGKSTFGKRTPKRPSFCLRQAGPMISPYLGSAGWALFATFNTPL